MVRAAAQAVRGESGHLLIVVDSLHSWAEAAPGGANEYEGLNLAMAALREVDQIAYIRFASVYRAFADIDSLREELEHLFPPYIND